jgi:hypothetical protein
MNLPLSLKKARFERSDDDTIGDFANQFMPGKVFGSQSGTINDYSGVGYYLATKLASEVPYDLEEDDWHAEIACLVERVEADEAENVWIWFREHLPKFMALVPIRHKMKFVSGVQRAHEDGRIES